MHYFRANHYLLSNLSTLDKVGAGKAANYKLSNRNKIPEHSLLFSRSGNDEPNSTIESGFGAITIAGGSMSITYYDENGTKLYTGEPIIPRNQDKNPFFET